MEEMSEQDRQAREAVLARRKRIAEGVARIMYLLAASFWLLVFLMLVRTGYLSRIGLTLGAVFVTSLIGAPLLGWSGRKGLEWVLLGVHFGLPALALAAVLLSFLWPKGGGTWRPYRFDDELAAIEARRVVPDTENAVHRYESVLREMNMGDEPNFVFRGTTSVRNELWKAPWKGSDYPQAAAWFDSQSAVIERLLEIGMMRNCRWPVQADTYDEYTVPYEKLRRSMVLLVTSGNRDLGEGHATKALAKHLGAIRIANHIRQQPSKVDAFAGSDCESAGLAMIRAALVHSDLSGDDLAQIADYLPPAADLWPQEWERLLEFEKLQYMNLLGRLYEVDGHGHVRFALMPVLSAKDEQKGAKNAGRFPWVYWIMSMPRDPREVRGIVERYFARFEHDIGSERPPRMDRHKQPPRMSRGDLAKGICNFYRWFAEGFFYSEREYVEHRHRRNPALTHRRGTWLVLGLRRYREAHGTWPQTLDAVSTYVPAEAFVDPTAEDAFVYALDGDSFRLYSRGANRLDEGGRRRHVKALHKSEDDIAIWPPPVPEPEEKLTDDEMLKLMEKIYGKSYVETYMRDKGSDKR